MGDPRKLRKKYDLPSHPWQKDRIEEERELIKEYGLKNKKEVWKAETMLKKFKEQVKSLATRRDDQAAVEQKQLVNRLVSLGLIKPGDALDVVLSLGVREILERRIQTLILKKGMARSINQARQFITHGHIMVDNRKITFPNYIVRLKEELLIQFVPTSTISKQEHPERISEGPKQKPKKKKPEKKEEAPPAFEADEIEEIEEKGVVEKKADEEEQKQEAEQGKKAEEKPGEKPELKEQKQENQDTKDKESKGEPEEKTEDNQEKPEDNKDNNENKNKEEK